MSKWKYEQLEPETAAEPSRYRIFSESDPSYEATLCELWSGEHDNAEMAKKICDALNLAAPSPPATAKDGMSDSCLTFSEIFNAIRELIDRIERCGASVELTHAVTLASDIRHAIGNKWNPADKYAAERVRAAHEEKEEGK